MDTKNDLKLGGALVPVPLTTAQVNSLEATAVTGSLVYNGTIDEWVKFDGTSYVPLNTDIDTDNQTAIQVPFSGGVNFSGITNVGAALLLNGNQISDLDDDIAGNTADITDLNALVATNITEIEEAKKTLFFKRESNGGSDNTVTLNSVSGTAVPFGGATLQYNPNNDFAALNNVTVRVNYDGNMRVDFSIPHTSTGARVHLYAYLRRIRGGVTTEHGCSLSYIRAASGHNDDTLNGWAILDCLNGDVYSIVTVRQGTIATFAGISAISPATQLFTKLNEV